MEQKLPEVLFVLGSAQENGLYNTPENKDNGIYEAVFIEDAIDISSYNKRLFNDYLAEYKFPLIVLDCTECSDLLSIIEKQHEGKLLGLHYGQLDEVLLNSTANVRHIDVLPYLEPLPVVNKVIAEMLTNG